jgi:diguanylate cyclase (GGDEF)-like protein/PAS domain S-box-containing protein
MVSSLAVTDENQGAELSGVLLPAGLALSPEVLIAEFPGPAMVIDSGGRLLGANAAAADMVAAIENLSDTWLPALVAAPMASRRPLVKRVQLTKQGDQNGITYDLTILPLSEDGRTYVLVLGRDASFQRNFTDALVASRQLFRDLVNCSSEFAWETRADGTFGFVTPQGALGYSARDLVDRPARDLVHPRSSEADPLPFESRVLLESAEVWLRTASGRAACLLVSCVPILDASGEWLGTRGVCRDVTETREREAELAGVRERERLLSGIVDTMRSEAVPNLALRTAAQATASATNAGECWIFRARDGGGFACVSGFATPAGAAPSEIKMAVATALGSRSDPRVFDQIVGDFRVLTAPSRYRAELNGAICLTRHQDKGAWSNDDRSVIDGVAAQLGIAIEQITTHERLERLSRTDALTDLLNRRAFFDDAGKRMEHLHRNRRRAALLYLDLDNFKAINDRLGHQEGDAVLHQIANMLARSSRAGDICGRLGGDEFVVWLEEADEAAASTKAEHLIEAALKVAARLDTGDVQLGLSIGVALSDPDSAETLEALVARADRAMYQAKRNGKGGFAVLTAAADDAAQAHTEAAPLSA